jgi:hypothetical protein
MAKSLPDSRTSVRFGGKNLYLGMSMGNLSECAGYHWGRWTMEHTLAARGRMSLALYNLHRRRAQPVFAPVAHSYRAMSRCLDMEGFQVGIQLRVRLDFSDVIEHRVASGTSRCHCS